MTDEILLEHLRKLGLKIYEAKGYLAMMKSKSLTATQISVVSGIPRTKVYDVTESLMKKGLCSLIPGKINKYKATEFDVAVDNLLGANQRNFVEREEQIRKASGNLRERLAEIYREASDIIDPLEYIEILKDPNLILRRFIQLVENATEEVLVFSKGPYITKEDTNDDQINQRMGISRKGIRGRCIYEIPADEDKREWFFNAIEKTVKSGEEARVIDELPMKMAIFESRIVFLALEDPISGRLSFTTQIIEHRSLAKGLTILFETLWAQAEDYHVLKG